MIGPEDAQSLTIPPSILDEITACAGSAYPEETCGVLGGKDDFIGIHIPVENMLHSPVRFRMDARQQLKAFQELDEKGWDLLAIWHSHPTGPDAPSALDVAEFLYPGVRAIILSPQREGWRARAFVIDGGQALSLDLIIQSR